MSVAKADARETVVKAAPRSVPTENVTSPVDMALSLIHIFSAFVTECDGLGSHRFTIKLTDTDTVTTVYDRTEYSIDVQLFYSDDLTIFYTIEADLSLIHI